MTDDLDDELNMWGRVETPPVDDAFANRLESQLRQEMVERQSSGTTGLSWLFRPGILVMGAVIVVIGIAFAFNQGEPSSVGVADDGSTTSAPTTTDPEPPTPTIATTTTVESTASAPDTTSTTLAASSTTATPSTQTTAAPTTSTSTTTIAATSTTVASLPEVVLTLERDARVILASWRVSGDVSDVAGWVLIRSIDGTDRVVETVREPRVRQVTSAITDLAQTFRVEGRAADGTVVVSSEDVAANRDG